MNVKEPNNLRPLGPRDSLGELLGDLATHSAALVKNEIELAKTEALDKAGKYSASLAVVGLGLVVIFLGVFGLCTAAVVGLAMFVSLITATLIVGGVLLLLGLIIAWVGYNRVKQIRPSLDQTIETLEENSQWVRSQVKS